VLVDLHVGLEHSRTRRREFCTRRTASRDAMRDEQHRPTLRTASLITLRCMSSDVELQDSDIELRDNPAEDRYEILVAGELAGVCEYSRRDGRIDLLHTEIDDRFEGHGLASKLIRFALDDARSSDTPVMPYCQFVRAFIAKHEEYLDLVPEEQRSRFFS
jgi:predicted GNAT family acetyltransferase